VGSNNHTALSHTPMLISKYYNLKAVNEQLKKKVPLVGKKIME
jgi:hypothetical protein